MPDREPDDTVRHLPSRIAQPLEDAHTAVAAVGDRLDARPDRREVMRTAAATAVVAAVVAVIVSVPLSISGARSQGRTDAAQDARAAALEQSQREDRARADDAYSAAQEANAELRKRGQQPVPVPKPQDADSVQDTLVAAAVAGTLAALPKTTRGPSAAELGRAVAAYMTANPAPSPSPRQIAAAVAAWLQAHPPADGTDGRDGQDGATGPGGPAGPTGPTGPPGPGPTAEEIQAAVRAEMDAQCPDGYTFRPLTGVLRQDDPGVVVNPERVTIYVCAPTT